MRVASAGVFWCSNCHPGRLVTKSEGLYTDSMTEVSRLVKEYLDYLEIEKNYSPKTRENYDRYLRAFIEFSRIRAAGEITSEKVKNFRKHLARGPAKKATQSYYLIALRNFLKYLVKNDYSVLAPEKIELPKVPMRQIELMEAADLNRLLKAPQGKTLRARRDRAILEVFFSTGLRLSELCNLSRYIDFKRKEVTVRGKGEKLRVVFLSDRARAAIKAYLDERPDANEFLFASLTRGGKLIGKITPRAVQRLVDYYARQAGITKRVSPHSLRHLFATDLLINGADIRSVQEMLGHANIATTQIYTHLTNKELKEVHEAFHARRRG